MSVEGLGQPSNKSCVFRNNEANLMTFYEDQHITEDVVEFPPGTELVRYPVPPFLQQTNDDSILFLFLSLIAPAAHWP